MMSYTAQKVSEQLTAFSTDSKTLCLIPVTVSYKNGMRKSYITNYTNYMPKQFSDIC